VNQVGNCAAQRPPVEFIESATARLLRIAKAQIERTPPDVWPSVRAGREPPQTPGPRMADHAH